MTEGIDDAAVTTWLSDHADGVQPPLQFDVIAGGHSNLTFRVTDDVGRRWVLRRPPLGHVLESAHDMGREARIISALAPTDVPVPPVVGLCADPDVTGAPFYVMEFVDGSVLRTPDDAAALAVESRARLSADLVDTLAAIHAVDLDEVGLGDLGKRDDYVARQLRRWLRQFHEGGTRELALIDEVHDELVARIPGQGPATIAHGDYRLDNCLVTPAGEVAAVLDWEICTLGDPLADLGSFLVYWVEAGDPFSPLGFDATTTEGFWRRDALVERYAQSSGRDVSNIAFYVAFAQWKLACILEGVYARYVSGARGEPPPDVQLFVEATDNLARAAADGLTRI